MAYTYHNWDEQATAPLRLARLRLHISEVAQQMGPDVNGADMSVSRGEIRQYLADLRAERDKLQADPANRTGGGVSLATFERQS